jgi:hypothetical protein
LYGATPRWTKSKKHKQKTPAIAKSGIKAIADARWTIQCPALLLAGEARRSKRFCALLKMLQFKGKKEERRRSEIKIILYLACLHNYQIPKKMATKKGQARASCS